MKHCEQQPDGDADSSLKTFLEKGKDKAQNPEFR
jgi:hypothetical protein